MKFATTLTLEGKFPSCLRVEVEKRPLLGREAAIARRLGETEKTLPVLCWKPGPPQKVALLDASLRVRDINTREDVIAFWQEIGPLFPGKEKPLPAIMEAVFVLQLLLVLRLAYAPQKGMPPTVAWIENHLLEPLKMAMAFCPKERHFRPVFYGGEICYLPAKKGDWPIFTLPKKWPGDRDGIINYAKGELTRNALARLRRVDISWTSKGIVIQPSCLYDAMLTAAVLEKPKAFAKKRLNTQAKQDALAYFRSLESTRGKFSKEIYKTVIKPAICRAWDRGEKDLARLREVGHNALKNFV